MNYDRTKKVRNIILFQIKGHKEAHNQMIRSDRYLRPYAWAMKYFRRVGGKREDWLSTPRCTPCPYGPLGTEKDVENEGQCHYTRSPPPGSARFRNFVANSYHVTVQ